MLAASGEHLQLGSVWEGQTRLVVWLRHFGCSFCLTETRTLMDRLEELREAGAELALVGNGSPQQAARFQQMHARDALVLTDPARLTYGILGARRSPLALLGPRDLRTWRRGRRLGVRSEDLQGDPMQLGAALLVAPGDHVLYAHLERSPGDQLDIDLVLASLASPVAG